MAAEHVRSSVPSQLGALVKLEVGFDLVCPGGQGPWTIPSEMGNMKSMTRYLALDSSPFEASIPSQLVNEFQA